MHRRMLAIIAGLSLALLVLAATGGATTDDEKIIVPQEMQNAINKMADAVGKGEKIDKDATAFFNKNKGKLKEAMWVFKPRAANGEGGLGIGPKLRKNTPDGIEPFIIIFANPRRRPMNEEDLKQVAEDLNRVADITFTMAEIAQRYCPTLEDRFNALKSVQEPTDNLEIAMMNMFGPTGLIAAQPILWKQSTPVWKQLTENMKQGATDLRAAVKASKPEDAKKALTKLYLACMTCHSKFRD